MAWQRNRANLRPPWTSGPVAGLCRGQVTRVVVAALAALALLHVPCSESLGQERPLGPVLERASDVEKQLRSRQPPTRRPEPPIPMGPAPSAVDEVGPLRFFLTDVAIQGATVFPAEDFVPLYEAFLFTQASTAEVSEILSRVTEL